MSDAKYVARATYITEETLALYQEAEAAVLAGAQSYVVSLPGGGNQTVTRANLTAIQNGIRELLNRRDQENAANGGPGSRAVNYARLRR